MRLHAERGLRQQAQPRFAPRAPEIKRRYSQKKRSTTSGFRILMHDLCVRCPQYSTVFPQKQKKFSISRRGLKIFLHSVTRYGKPAADIPLRGPAEGAGPCGSGYCPARPGARERREKRPGSRPNCFLLVLHFQKNDQNFTHLKICKNRIRAESVICKRDYYCVQILRTMTNYKNRENPLDFL